MRIDRAIRVSPHLAAIVGFGLVVVATGGVAHLLETGSMGWGDLDGWVQGIGTIVAVAWAADLARRENRRLRQQAHDDKLRDVREVTDQMIFHADRLIAITSSINEGGAATLARTPNTKMLRDVWGTASQELENARVTFGRLLDAPLSTWPTAYLHAQAGQLAHDTDALYGQARATQDNPQNRVALHIDFREKHIPAYQRARARFVSALANAPRAI